LDLKGPAWWSGRMGCLQGYNRQPPDGGEGVSRGKANRRMFDFMNPASISGGLSNVVRD